MRRTSLIRTPLILAGAAVLPLIFASAAGAQENRPREAVINVAGQGDAATAPDMAIVSLSVLRQAKTAEAAVTANNAAMKDVLAALKQAGIADRDVATSHFSIYPRYRRDEGKNGQVDTQEVTGYDVSNGLTVKVRDLSKLGSLIDTSVRLGVNQGGQIVFTNDKPDAVIAEARKAAMAEAITKAKTLAEAAGVKLGRIIEINENSVMAPPPMPAPMMRMAMAKEADSVPVAAGEKSYSVTVNVTFALDQ